MAIEIAGILAALRIGSAITKIGGLFKRKHKSDNEESSENDGKFEDGEEYKTMEYKE